MNDADYLKVNQATELHLLLHSRAFIILFQKQHGHVRSARRREQLMPGGIPTQWIRGEDTSVGRVMRTCENDKCTPKGQVVYLRPIQEGGGYQCSACHGKAQDRTCENGKCNSKAVDQGGWIPVSYLSWEVVRSYLRERRLHVKACCLFLPLNCKRRGLRVSWLLVGTISDLG